MGEKKSRGAAGFFNTGRPAEAPEPAEALTGVRSAEIAEPAEVVPADDPKNSTTRKKSKKEPITVHALDVSNADTHKRLTVPLDEDRTRRLEAEAAGVHLPTVQLVRALIDELADSPHLRDRIWQRVRAVGDAEAERVRTGGTD